MATVEFTTTQVAVTTGGGQRARNLHRIRTVRLQQGVSLRSAARHMKSDVRTLRMQEQESTDMQLSELRRWQKALDVPLAELLEESDSPLSAPVLERARMVRLMKTAMAIHEQTESSGLKRMAQMMIDQLVEVMPELQDVSPWHTYGQRRSLDEYGRVAERRLSDSLMQELDDSV
ncbi:MAG: hypothetical protein QGG36_13180 [Pirellulaceae bacterium]|jgi:transcriptional regulator with XRE-family HTH domain|nr:hypothetical protein [Pirellulaceae bacterium]MDP7016748.1 hypothetical protein [Pirellulaceae bacterium]